MAKQTVVPRDKTDSFLCSDNYPFTAPVGRFGRNAFGLYDMLGNVSEWTEDYYSDSYHGAPADGSVWKAGNVNLRVVRGGGWFSNPRFVRSAGRLREGPVFRSNYIGFRVSRTD